MIKNFGLLCLIILGASLTTYAQTNLASLESIIFWSTSSDYENGSPIPNYLNLSKTYELSLTYQTNNPYSPIIKKTKFEKSNCLFSELVGQNFPSGPYRLYIRAELPYNNYSKWTSIDFYYVGANIIP